MTGIIIVINTIFADESGLMFVQGGSVVGGYESMANENTTINDGNLSIESIADIDVINAKGCTYYIMLNHVQM